jgi:antitoxin component YwqK of YwqJK toxin-antitoxin module
MVKYQSIYKGNKVDGYSRDFYDDGTINVVKFYKNGKEQAKIEQRLKNNKLVLNNGNGTYYTFYPSGKKSTESEHRLGKRDGKTSWYYENGQLDQTIIYKYDDNLIDGLRWEVLSSFDKNGKPREKGTLKNGNGTIILYDSNGEKSGVMNIQNGVLISTTKI